MNRTLLGALASLLLCAAGLFWWQGRAATEAGAPLPAAALPAEGEDVDPFALPEASGRGLRGPQLPVVDEASREERRFNRVDRDRDGRVTRNEMLGLRVAAYRKLDADGNNLLSFEEWAVKTGNRFKGADANGDGALSRVEFTATKPRERPQQARPRCICAADSDGESSEPD